MSTEEKVAALLAAIDAAQVRATADGETRTLDPVQLRALVRAHEDAIPTVVRDYVEQAPPDRHGWFQLALLLAVLYQEEFGDDTLTLYVGLQVRRRGLAMTNALPGLDGKEPELRVFSFDAAHVADLDFTALERELADDGSPAGRERLRGLRDRCLLEFGTSEDEPRDVWSIPEVRTFVGEIARRFPHVPYFLCGAAGFDALITYFGALLGPNAFDARFRLVVWRPDVRDTVAASMRAVAEFAKRISDDPERAVRDVLRSCPEPIVDQIVDVALRAEATR
ncbi:MAG: hypothetical protein M3N49_04085 [Candidatus Eremiobacteraeota bacterium]|nr:hypothetical protein [Candidatus Eremiobacteraeota bacterium]